MDRLRRLLAVCRGDKAWQLKMFTDKYKEWGLEGAGMDVVFRLVDPDQELADFLFCCSVFFDDGTDGSGT